MHRLPPISQLERTVECKRTSSDGNSLQPRKKFKTEPLSLEKNMKKNLKINFLKKRNSVKDTVPELTEDFGNDKWLPEDQPLEENGLLMSYTIEDLNVEYELVRDEIITLNLPNNFDNSSSFEANARLKIEPIHDENFCFKEEPIYFDNFSFKDNEGFENAKDCDGCNNEISSSPMFQQMNEQSVIPTAQTIEDIEKGKGEPSINYSNEFNDFINTKDYNVVLKEPISVNEFVKEKNLNNNLNFKVSKKVNSKSSKNKPEISKEGKFKQQDELIANSDTSNKKKKLTCYKKNYGSTSVQKKSKYSKNSKEDNLSNNSSLKIKISKSSKIEPEINKRGKIKHQKKLIANCDTSNKKEKITDYTKKNCKLIFSLQKNNKHSKNSKDKNFNLKIIDLNLKVSEKTNSKSSKNKLAISKRCKVKNLKKLIIINDASNEKENLTSYQKKISRLISPVKKNSKRSKNSNSFERPKNIYIPQVETNLSANHLAEKGITVKETLNSNRYSKDNKRLKSIEIQSASSDLSINNLFNQDNNQNCLTSKNTPHNKADYESRTELLTDSNYVIENNNTSSSSFHIQTNSSANILDKKNNRLQRTDTDFNIQLNNDEQLINTQGYKSPGKVSNINNLLVQDIAAKNSFSIIPSQAEEIKMDIVCKERELSNLFVDSNILNNKSLTEGDSNDASCNNIAGINNTVFFQNLKQSTLERGKENYEITKSETNYNSDSEVLHNLKDFVNLVNSTKRSSEILLTSEIRNKVPKLKIRDDIYQNFESNSAIINLRSSSNNEIILEQHNPHISTNYIKLCLDRWKIRYPWVRFNENEGTLSCEICSVLLAPYVVWEVKSSEDVFKIAASLLSHSTLKFHEILFCIRNPKIFQKIYASLKNIIPHFTSRQLLYFYINKIIKHIGKITISDQSIELIINTIASTLKKTLLKHLLAYSGCGISYTCDPYRKILIARIPNAKHFPEEFIVADFMDSSLSLNNYLVSKGFNNKNITFKKTFENMGCSSSGKADNSSFPLRWPSSKELLSWMLTNDAIRAYSGYIKNLSVLYNKYTANFNLIKDAYILANASWENFHVYRLLLKNTPQIKSIILDLYKTHSDINAKFCYTYTIDKGGIFYNIIDTISYITWYVDTQQFSNNEKEFRYKISNFLILLERIDMKHIYDMPLKILTIYCREVLRDEYHIGKKNILGCQFLFQPKRLACLNTSEATFEELSFIQNLNTMFRHHLPSCEQFLENLSRFGHYLCQFVNKSYIPIYEMCNIFGTSPYLRLNYSYVQIFYIILSTLPIFIAVPRISHFGVSASMHFFNYYFGQALGKDLLTIFYGTTKDVHIQQLNDDVVYKILSLNEFRVPIK